ncbi:hypothetical protein QFC22_004551 [Naganishia vaughanmartiniae]|uniref:Uncharacterized protein n=1 Tax=Naganishia vaughanmartiniae TaxID=1424756 RepID=A0ACC2X0J1_9TREE|nr:hypothetical protein QFC22_004551 [Naganishia vaughanmartiniae]
MTSQESTTLPRPTKNPLRLITSLKEFAEPSLTYSPAALFARPSLRDASASPARVLSNVKDVQVIAGSKKAFGSFLALDTSSPAVRPGPIMHTRRRSQTWTSPTNGGTAARKISNTLSTVERPGFLLAPMIARSPSASCLPTRSEKMGYLLPPPRSRSRSSHKTLGKEDDEISYLAESSLNLSSSPTSLHWNNLNTVSADSTSPMSFNNKGISALPRVPSLMMGTGRRSLHRQSSNSSLAEPRMANVEVTSRWSTAVVNPRRATKELNDLRDTCISTAVDKPTNPFLSGFRSEHLKRSSSVSKHGQKPSPLRPTHQRHVSAPMVSGSIANFLIAPPLEARPQARENPHRKATTALSRQPSRLEMRNRDVFETDSPATQKGLLSTVSVEQRITALPVATKDDRRPSLSRASSGSWTRSFLDAKFLPRRSRNVERAINHNCDEKAEPEQNRLNGAVDEEGGDEEEIEVFLGLDDI